MYHEGSFDVEADVVVVGLGDAGAVAAMTAADLGGSVLIVEKQDEDKRRPNSRFSGGIFIAPNDIDGAIAYMTNLYRVSDDLFETDPAVIRAWAVETAKNPSWLRSLGGACVPIRHGGEHRFVEGHDAISIWKPDMNVHPNGTGHRGWGWGLFKFLSDQVADRHIDVMYGSSAQWLLTSADGNVIGVRVTKAGRDINIRAGRGVVLASGGFEFNQRMKLNYLKAFPTHFYGNPENTGDGITMAQEVGAELWHMNSCAGRLVAHFPDSGYPGGVPIDIWGIEGPEGPKVLMGEVDKLVPADGHEQLPGALFVNRAGRRFTNELYRAHTLYYELTDLDSQNLEYPKIPSWWVFDERRRLVNPLTPTYFSPTGPLQQVSWSSDNSEEIARGWVASAPTIVELADKCGIEPLDLQHTVDRYNTLCAAGEDTDFGRPLSTLTPIDAPPYYAVQLWPGGPNTQGGPRRNADAQVMRVTGQPIPGLYAAGELGSIYGKLYPAGGGNIAECLAFGRIAGRNAATQRSARPPGSAPQGASAHGSTLTKVAAGDS